MVSNSAQQTVNARVGLNEFVFNSLLEMENAVVQKRDSSILDSVGRGELSAD